MASSAFPTGNTKDTKDTKDRTKNGLQIGFWTVDSTTNSIPQVWDVEIQE